MDNVKEFRCRDSRVAAFIAHLGIRHARTEPSGYSSFVFVFDDPGDCDKLSYDLFAGAGTTDALSLLDSYRGINVTIRAVKEHGAWTNKETD